MANQETLKRRLEELKSEHRDLDNTILKATKDATYNQIEVQRLKKRKLALKDLITRLESQLLPDIIA